MFSFFKPKDQSSNPITSDIHSHLLPNLDDGVKSLQESVSLIKQFVELGYRKIITTPHVMSDYYRNSNEQIEASLEELIQYLKSEQVDIEIEAAAEYYLDEELLNRLENGNPLLTFGKEKFLLFETNFLTEPFQLKNFIFLLTTQGYKPVLAHPERYQYLVNDFAKIEDLRNRGVYFQINVPSIVGAYSKPIQTTSIELIKKGWVEFLGSDCHNQIQFEIFKSAMKAKYYKKALDLPLLNRSL
ncbi:MAG: CpsB/CapC family capsule biosynthesis tyrosine phosphatase [Cyclobacteriaceae bacterium]